MDAEIEVCRDIFCAFVINFFDIVSVFQNRHSRCVLLIGGSCGAFTRNTFYEYLFKKKNKISLSLGVAFVIIFAALISISIIQMVLFFRSVI